MKLVNLTERDITLLDKSGERHTFPSQGVAKCLTHVKEVNTILGIPIMQSSYDRIESLPSVSRNMQSMYIVSEEVAEAARGIRFDLLIPHNHVEGDVYRALAHIGD